MTTLGSSAVLLTSLALLCVAIPLFVWSLYPRRRGPTPHCRQCSYNLSGTNRTAPAPRCPECGGDLTSERAVVHGERHRRPWLIGAASLLTVIALAASAFTGFQWSRSVDWYRWKPTAWVIGDAESAATPAVADRAWRELLRRYHFGEIAQKHFGRLARTALADHAAATVTPVIRQFAADLLGRMLIEKRLSEAQISQFLDNLGALGVTITRVRPVNIHGQRPVISEPYAVALSPLAPAPNGPAIRWTGSEHAFDGTPFDGGGNFEWNSGGFGAQHISSSVSAWHLPAGDHRHSCSVRIQLFRSTPLEEALAEKTVHLENAFTIPPHK